MQNNSSSTNKDIINKTTKAENKKSHHFFLINKINMFSLLIFIIINIHKYYLKSFCFLFINLIFN